MTLEEKKGFVLRYIRLGMDPLSSMILAECRDDEIEKLEADKDFTRSCELALRLEEAQLLERFKSAMHNNLAKDDTRDAKWFLEKIDSRFGAASAKASIGAGKSRVNIQIDFGTSANGQDEDDSNVETFEGAPQVDPEHAELC